MAGSFVAVSSGLDLAVETCHRRLEPVVGKLASSGPIDWGIVWDGAGEGRHASTEATIQARCGLMEVHGWDGGMPQRVALEVATVTSGLLAASGVLAGLIGIRRGQGGLSVETSVLHAGLWLVAHHVAAATSGGDLLPSPPGPDPGPPFRTADGASFEIEVFDAEVWARFWRELGAPDAGMGRAWTAFRSRYYRGRCSLPPGLHEATVRHRLSELVAVAEGCGVSLMPLRSYREVADDPGIAIPPRPSRPASRTGLRADDQKLTGRENPGLPLEGIEVVEATNRMQGPLAGLLLHMLGASVVKVEPPGGDIGRMVPPACGEVGTFFQCYNRGKSTVELDLGRPEGRSELLARLRHADVFLHNWRPGKAAEWRLDPPSVAAVNRHVVYAAATGWGGSPLDERIIGTDFLVQAFAGFGEGLAPWGSPPRTTRVLLADCLGAIATCESILAALYRREASGRGASVTPSLLAGAMAAQAHVLDGLQAGGRRDGRAVWGPLDQPVVAEGAAVVFGIDGDGGWHRLRDLCGLDRAPRSPEAEAAVVARIGESPADHWARLCAGAQLPFAQVARDLSALPQGELAPLLEPLDGPCHAPRSPWLLG